jgi:coenzyme F420-reducing hydrogenase alpha subunit
MDAARPWTPYQRLQGMDMAATEAPRGLLFHRYTIDETGLILSSKIVPPTAQNLKRIEDDLRRYLPQVISAQWAAPVEEITWRAEQAIRNYDPCISCATHFLKVRVTHEE